MKVDQRLMRLAAEQQAEDRAKREGKPMRVYRRFDYPTQGEVTWYVCSEEEGYPENGELAYYYPYR